jgi:hypothetical protein
VLLQDPGNLNRVITRAQLTSRRGDSRTATGTTRPRPQSVRQLQQASYGEAYAQAAPILDSAPMTVLEGDVKVRLLGPGQMPESGHVREANVSVGFEPGVIRAPYELILDAADLSVKVRIPGTTKELLVRSDEVESGRRILTVRVRTTNPFADSIGAYMNRGDLHSAAAMTDWAEKAEDLLQDKMADPFAAAAGAYLLLRLRRFDLMRSWTKNLADWFPDVTDGRVIWAWQQIYSHGNEAEIRQSLQLALQGSVPVFTEGMRLLRDGAQAIGSDAVTQLNRRCGVVLWNSPFTTTSWDKAKFASMTPAISVNIDYASSA